MNVTICPIFHHATLPIMKFVYVDRDEGVAMTLDQLGRGNRATVTKISGEGGIRRRLMDMGIIKGTTVEMVKSAPMGDPIDYLVRGYHLSLRKSEALLVEVEPC